MIFERLCGLLSAGLIVGTLALPVGGTSFAYAQESGMGDFCSVHSTTGDAMVDHIVLHDLRLENRGNKIDNYSAAVLDYVARLINDEPRPIVCVEILPVRFGAEFSPGRQPELTNHQVQAVNIYLKKKGVDIHKLVLVVSALG